MIYQFAGELFPDYLKHGNAQQYIAPIALKFCKGIGLDIGCGKWPLEGAIGMELNEGADAMALPNSKYEYIFSSHALEHLTDPVGALMHWQSRLKSGGVLFLYLPHPDMKYWRPESCRRHRSLFWPKDVAEMLKTLGFTNVLHSERDMAWSFSVVGFNP